MYEPSSQPLPHLSACFRKALGSSKISPLNAGKVYACRSFKMFFLFSLCTFVAYALTSARGKPRRKNCNFAIGQNGGTGYCCRRMVSKRCVTTRPHQLGRFCAKVGVFRADSKNNAHRCSREIDTCLRGYEAMIVSAIIQKCTCVESRANTKEQYNVLQIENRESKTRKFTESKNRPAAVYCFARSADGAFFTCERGALFCQTDVVFVCCPKRTTIIVVPALKRTGWEWELRRSLHDESGTKQKEHHHRKKYCFRDYSSTRLIIRNLESGSS